MKRIGILTYHRSFNYGALMQSYSLSTRIAKDFPEAKVELIDYCSKKVYLMYNENFKNYVELINETEGFRQKLTFFEANDFMFRK